MTTLFDEFIWDGGQDRFNNVETWQKWREDGKPYVSPKRDDKSADDIFPQKSEAEKRIEKLEKKLDREIEKIRSEREHIETKVKEQLKTMNEALTSMQIFNQLLTTRVKDIEKDNKRLRDLLNEYDKFDIMEFEDE